MTQGVDDAHHPNRKVGRERYTQTVESAASFQARQDAFANPGPSLSDEEFAQANALLEDM